MGTILVSFPFPKAGGESQTGTPDNSNKRNQGIHITASIPLSNSHMCLYSACSRILPNELSQMSCRREGKEWWWEESTSGLFPKGSSSKGAWKDQGKCLLGNIVSTGILVQVSKHIQLAGFLLLTLQGTVIGSQEQAREERKALFSGDGKRGGANICSHSHETLWGLSPMDYTSLGSNLWVRKWNWLWHKLFIRKHSLLTNYPLRKVSVFKISVSFQFPHWKRLWKIYPLSQ